MGLVMTGYSVCVFKAIMVDCLFFARLPVEVEHGSSPPGSKGHDWFSIPMCLVGSRLTV